MLEELSDSLMATSNSAFWSPLPLRENAIKDVNLFISQSFFAPCPRVLILLGPKNTGKTSVIRWCALMSEFEPFIRFVDCAREDPFMETFSIPVERKLIVFDHLCAGCTDGTEGLRILKLIEHYKETNSSMIFVISSRNIQHWQEIVSRIPPDFCPGATILNKYERKQLVDVLKVKTEEISRAVPDRVIEEICKKCSDNDLDLVDAQRMLYLALEDAVNQGKDRVEISEIDKLTYMDLEHRFGESNKSRGGFELSLDLRK